MRETVPGYAGLSWDAPAVVGNDASASPTAAYDVLLERRLENPAEILAAVGTLPVAGGTK
jgi:hypothetical protein